jgi:hypothetical protein
MTQFFQAGTIGIYFYIGMSIVGIVGAVIFIYRLLHEYKNLQDEGSNLMKGNNYEQEWHKSTDAPCPGSLIVCEDSKHKLYFGYAVAYNGRPCLWQIPNYLTDFRNPPKTLDPQMLHPTLPYLAIVMYSRWQYIERRILPTETLRTYADQYKEESK